MKYRFVKNGKKVIVESSMPVNLPSESEIVKFNIFKRKIKSKLKK